LRAASFVLLERGMSAQPEIQCYEYVNHSYEEVSQALVHDAVGLFERATQQATNRASKLVTKLEVSIGGFEVGRNVVVRVLKANTHADAPAHIADRATELELEWHAEKSAALFPAMRAKLTVYPLAKDETQLQLVGEYAPPGGVFGSVADKLVGHRIAEASVHAFLDALARRMNDELC
jgi:hypothetical protein